MLLAAAAPCALFAAGDAVAASPDPARYAPEVRLAGDEQLFPVRPEGFIAHADLVWYGCGSTASERVSGVDPSRLGARADDPYSSPPYWSDGRASCPPAPVPTQTVTFRSNEWTRPRGGPPRAAPLRTFPANGFALDLQDEFRPGNHNLDSVTVNYERGRTAGGGRWITYWLFYAYNAKNDDLHEGDWERVSLRFDRAGEPKQVAYYAHSGSPRICAWGDVRRTGKRHPVVFSALGSHASYPRAGEFSVGSGGGVDDADGQGPRWRTWRSGVRSASQPWYGFGGAWGERGPTSTTTGPAGPGQRTAADWGRHGLKTCDRP